MKQNITFLILVAIGIFSMSCNSDTNDDEATSNEVRSFLSDIRANYFQNLNYESDKVVAAIPSFLEDFKQTYDKLEQEYKAGVFSSSEDLEYMRLAQLYYSFYIIGVTGSYLDGNMEFEEIFGNRETGLFSGIPSDAPDYQQKEIEAMMQRAVDVAAISANINGYNDRAYGFYVIVKQVQERVRNSNFNNKSTHDLAIDLSLLKIKDYVNVPVWNLLSIQIAMTNYSDILNSFNNSRMNELLQQANERLGPDALPDLGGELTEILGPLYRFDLNLKKLDWMFRNFESFDTNQLEEIDYYITVLDIASNFIATDKKKVLDTWTNKYTFDQRIEKMIQIKNYRQSISEGGKSEKPELESFIDSKDFKKAYQCYACHQFTNQ